MGTTAELTGPRDGLILPRCRLFWNTPKKQTCPVPVACMCPVCARALGARGADEDVLRALVGAAATSGFGLLLTGSTASYPPAAPQSALCCGCSLLVVLFGQFPVVLVKLAGALGMRSSLGAARRIFRAGLLSRAGDAPVSVGTWTVAVADALWTCPGRNLEELRGGWCWQPEPEAVELRWARGEEARGAGSGPMKSGEFGGRGQGRALCCMWQVRGARDPGVVARLQMGLSVCSRALMTRVWTKLPPFCCSWVRLQGRNLSAAVCPAWLRRLLCRGKKGQSVQLCRRDLFHRSFCLRSPSSQAV